MENEIQNLNYLASKKWEQSFFEKLQTEMFEGFGGEEGTVEYLFWEAFIHLFATMNKGFYPELDTTTLQFQPTRKALTEFKFKDWNHSIVASDKILVGLAALKNQ